MDGTDDEIDYAAGILGGFDATAHGRPRDLATRIKAVVRLLDCDGYTPSPKVVQAVMLWEQVVAGMVGDDPEDSDFALVGGAFQSARVAAADEALEEAGFYTDAALDEPDLIPARYGSSEGVRSWFKDQPGQWTPWFRAMHEFVWGFHDPDGSGSTRCSVQHIDTERDVLTMLAVDPVAAMLADGLPAGRRLHDGGVRLLADLGEATRKARQPIQKPHEAAWFLATFLCRKAAERDPRFGGRDFISLVEATRHVDARGDDGVVETVFLDAGGKEGARLRRIPGPEGRVVRIEVPEAMRGRGFGTLALRHAQSEGIPATDPVPEEAGGLFGRHGRRQADGGYVLCRVSWPRCKPAEPVPEASPAP
jgi:hypothetical protein